MRRSGGIPTRTKNNSNRDSCSVACSSDRYSIAVLHERMTLDLSRCVFCLPAGGLFFSYVPQKLDATNHKWYAQSAATSLAEPLSANLCPVTRTVWAQKCADTGMPRSDMSRPPVWGLWLLVDVHYKSFVVPIAASSELTAPDLSGTQTVMQSELVSRLKLLCGVRRWRMPRNSVFLKHIWNGVVFRLFSGRNFALAEHSGWAGF